MKPTFRKVYGPPWDPARLAREAVEEYSCIPGPELYARHWLPSEVISVDGWRAPADERSLEERFDVAEQMAYQMMNTMNTGDPDQRKLSPANPVAFMQDSHDQPPAGEPLSSLAQAAVNVLKSMSGRRMEPRQVKSHLVAIKLWDHLPAGFKLGIERGLMP